MNPHELLEISPDASPEDVKVAYHRLAKKWHPDRFSGAEKTDAEKRFRQLSEAFNMLKDVARREESKIPAASVPTQTTIQLQEEHGPAPVPLHERKPADWFDDAQKAFDSKEYERALGLVQYCIRLDAEKADYQVLLAKVLDKGGGDKKALVKALESAIRLNPKDVDSIIRLAELFQSVGMHARATRLWETARNLAPNHKIFVDEAKKSEKRAAAQTQGLGEQFSVLVEEGKALINRLLKRG